MSSLQFDVLTLLSTKSTLNLIKINSLNLLCTKSRKQTGMRFPLSYIAVFTI